MKKSIFGQVMAFSILIVPVLILSWFIIAPTTNGVNSGIITTIATWVLGAVLITILLYFVSAIAWKHSGIGVTAINGVKSFFGTEKTKGIKGFMENEDKFWLLGFIVVAVITILLYTVLDEDGSDRWRIVGLITLVGMHVFIFWNFIQALFYEGRLHQTTKFFVGACLIFWSIALFTPNFAEWTVTETKGAVSAFDADFDPETMAKGKVVQQSAPADNNTGLYVAIQTLQVFPSERFKKVSIPPGRVIKDLTWDCPDGCILEIVHDGQPLCPTTSIYQGLPCGSLQPENGNSGDTVQREQFAIPYGNFIKFPRNLVLIGVSFGTDENLGPIEVTATVTI